MDENVLSELERFVGAGTERWIASVERETLAALIAAARREAVLRGALVEARAALVNGADGEDAFAKCPNPCDCPWQEEHELVRRMDAALAHTGATP